MHVCKRGYFEHVRQLFPPFPFSFLRGDGFSKASMVLAVADGKKSLQWAINKKIEK